MSLLCPTVPHTCGLHAPVTLGSSCLIPRFVFYSNWPAWWWNWLEAEGGGELHTEAASPGGERSCNYSAISLGARSQAANPRLHIPADFLNAQVPRNDPLITNRGPLKTTPESFLWCLRTCPALGVGVWRSVGLTLSSSFVFSRFPFPSGFCF